MISESLIDVDGFGLDAEEVLLRLEDRTIQPEERWGWIRCDLDGIHYLIIRNDGRFQYLSERDGVIHLTTREDALRAIRVHAIELRNTNNQGGSE